MGPRDGPRVRPDSASVLVPGPPRRRPHRAIVEAYVLEPVKPPWYIGLLNLNLNVVDLSVSEERIRRFLDAFGRDGTRITCNLDFDSEN